MAAPSHHLAISVAAAVARCGKGEGHADHLAPDVLSWSCPASGRATAAATPLRAANGVQGDVGDNASPDLRAVRGGWSCRDAGSVAWQASLSALTLVFK